MNNILFVMGEIPAPCTNFARPCSILARKTNEIYETRDNRVITTD
jgi:hypothetical protein